jgi:acetyl esterase/lipase
MQARRRLFVGAAAGLAVLWLAVRHRQLGVYFWNLYNAKRVADRFYAECPTVFKNIAYHPSTPRRLDVYRPADGSGYLVVVYVYGGSWNSGNKELYASAAQRLLPEGAVVVIPDYTLYPAGGYPRQSQEIAAALAWTLENIAAYGGDPGKLVVAAQSAGGQVAGLAVFDPRFLAAHGRSAAEVRGFVGISGVYDITTQLAHERRQGRSGRYVESVIGGRGNISAASPLTFAGPSTPPTLLIHGDADGTVPVRVSHDLHARLKAAGANCELMIYPGAGHSSIMFDALAHNPSRLLADIMAFVRQCTDTPATVHSAGPDAEASGPADSSAAPLAAPR